MACIIVIWLFATFIYQFMFYITRNPFVFCYYTCSNNLWMLGKLLLKLAPAIFLVIDSELKFDVLYFVSLIALNSGYLFGFRFMFSYYRSNQHIESVLLRCETCSTVVVISLIPLHFISSMFP